jgi:hypothetical protein
MWTRIPSASAPVNKAPLATRRLPHRIELCYTVLSGGANNRYFEFDPPQNIGQRIKRAILTGNYAFSEKARIEMEADQITELDVAESILNAVAIYKSIRSVSPHRSHSREMLHIIQSTNLNGLAIYSKGKLVSEAGQDTYYFLISSKKAL